MVFVSVIIPSAGRRPELLQRAIKSALIDDEQIETEIIVVLNGRDGIDFDTNQSFQHRLVTYYKIEQGNVSKARNYGLSVAQGELIRFLDDDDFLIPDMAYQQYIQLYYSDAELSTYAGAIEDNQSRYQVIVPINTDDYYSAVMSANCPALTFATVYKDYLVNDLKWNENLSFMEDENWMRTIAYKPISFWIRAETIVGIWYQHRSERLSIPIGCNDYYKYRAISIIDLLKHLESVSQLTQIRKKFAVMGLWSAIHGGFPFKPFEWYKIYKITTKLDKSGYPEQLLFIRLKFINPLLLEILIYPLRKMSRFCRVIKHAVCGKPFKRYI